ncbi:MAG: prepilin peptidase [Polyangiales bacterium]
MTVTDVAPWLVRILAFFWGAIWGSFFNVAIYRWPLELSVVSPPSRCPACEKEIKAWHNVPIFGWLFLRGRAACCGAKISPRYPLIELITAITAVAIAQTVILQADAHAGLLNVSMQALIYFFFAGGLIVATFVDLDWMQIPDEVSLPGTALGLITCSFRTWPGAVPCAVGAGLGYLIVQFLFVWGYERLFGRRGMGEGDSKLLMMIGAFIGYKGVLFALVAGSFQGIFYAGTMLVFGRSVTPPNALEPEEQPDNHRSNLREVMPQLVDVDKAAAPIEGDGSADVDVSPLRHLRIPFGPFLALGALEYFFWGDAIIDGYFRFLRSFW